jgi:hypothetical protein
VAFVVFPIIFRKNNSLCPFHGTDRGCETTESIAELACYMDVHCVYELAYEIHYIHLLDIDGDHRPLVRVYI